MCLLVLQQQGLYLSPQLCLPRHSLSMDLTKVLAERAKISNVTLTVQKPSSVEGWHVFNYNILLLISLYCCKCCSMSLDLCVYTKIVTHHNEKLLI